MDRASKPHHRSMRSQVSRRNLIFGGMGARNQFLKRNNTLWVHSSLGLGRRHELRAAQQRCDFKGIDGRRDEIALCVIDAMPSGDR